MSITPGDRGHTVNDSRRFIGRVLNYCPTTRKLYLDKGPNRTEAAPYTFMSLEHAQRFAAKTGATTVVCDDPLHEPPST